MPDDEIKRVIERLREDLSRGFMAGDEIAADLARLLDYASSCADPWRPIESAPSDGTYILAWAATWDYYPVLIKWDEDEGEWIDKDGLSFTEEDQPTRWMPAPQPPKEREK